MRASSSYLHNIPLLFTPLGKYTSDQLVTDQFSQSKRAGFETISLLMITEGSKEFAVGGSQPLRRSGYHLDDTTSCITKIQSK